MTFNGLRNQIEISLMDIKRDTRLCDQRQRQGTTQMGPKLLNANKKRSGIIELRMIQCEAKIVQYPEDTVLELRGGVPQLDGRVCLVD